MLIVSFWPGSGAAARVPPLLEQLQCPERITASLSLSLSLCMLLSLLWFSFATVWICWTMERFVNWSFVTMNRAGYRYSDQWRLQWERMVTWESENKNKTNNNKKKEKDCMCPLVVHFVRDIDGFEFVCSSVTGRGIGWEMKPWDPRSMGGIGGSRVALIGWFFPLNWFNVVSEVVRRWSWSGVARWNNSTLCCR